MFLDDQLFDPFLVAPSRPKLQISQGNSATACKTELLTVVNDLNVEW